MQTFYVSEFDAHLHYHDLPGAAPTCVYLHGLGAASSADFPLIVRHARLAGYRALLVDFLGFGFSEHPAAFPYMLAAHAETVAHLLNHLGVRRAHLIGHSMGGSIAIALAAAHPELVSGLVVAECNFDPEDATFSKTITDQSVSEEEFVESGRAALIAQAQGWVASEPWMGSYVGTMRVADPRAIYRCSVALVNCRLREAFLAANMPRTYIFGERTLPHHHEPLLEAVGVPMAVIPQAGHGMVGDNPEAFAAVLASTIAGQEIPAPYRHPGIS